MTTFLLIRHALCDPVGRLIAGRLTGVHLNESGKQQALKLAERLSQLSLTALYSSPLERAIETAQPIAALNRLEILPAPGFNEVDFGSWTGKTIAELEPLPEWRRFNEFRSAGRIPAGESMAEVLSRCLGELERLRKRHPQPGTLVAVVSHGDVLRMLVTHALGMPSDLIHRIELSPASVTALEVEDYGSRLLLLNGTGGWPAEMRKRNG
ncbi:MAG: histidine phosphatase family protein [Gemmatimonadales bacterium]